MVGKYQTGVHKEIAMNDSSEEEKAVIILCGDDVVCGAPDDVPHVGDPPQTNSGPLEDDGIIPPDLHQ